MPRSVLYKSMSLDGVITGPDDDAVEHAGVQARLATLASTLRSPAGALARAIASWIPLAWQAVGGRLPRLARHRMIDEYRPTSIPSPSAKAYR
jgi:hypothetical protein